MNAIEFGKGEEIGQVEEDGYKVSVPWCFGKRGYMSRREKENIRKNTL